MSSRAKVEMKSVEIVAENKRQHLGDSLGSGEEQPLATEGKSQIFDKNF